MHRQHLVVIGIPRLYAAASLKPQLDADRIAPGGGVFRGFMPRPSLKHDQPLPLVRGGERIPRLYAAASLKRRHGPDRAPAPGARIPRLYAAASLKRPEERHEHVAAHRRIPRLYAAALIEAARQWIGISLDEIVFRGFMPRPH